jgi:hypothetical protein
MSVLSGNFESDWELVQAALSECKGVKTCAAKKLGTSEATIRRKVQKARETLDEDHKIDRLEGQVKLLEKQLATARESVFRDKDFEQFVRAALSSSLKTPTWVAGAGEPDKENVAVQLLSDIHFPEIVDPKQVYGLNGYDARIAGIRLQKFFEGGARITNEIFNIPVRGTVQLWIGDMLSGNIHDELLQTNEYSLMEAVLRLAEMLVAGVRLHLDAVDTPLHIVCVPGNHGRLTKKPKAKGYNTDNVDWLLFHLVARELKDEPRVTFQVGTATDHQVNINGFVFHVTHGNQARGGGGMVGPIAPIVRLDVKKRRWAMQTGHDYDYLVTGHFHTFIPNLYGVVVNGSLVGYDEYATSNNLSYQPPQQGYFLVHPTRGITYSTPIFVESKEEGWQDGEVRLQGVHPDIDVAEDPAWLIKETT